MSLDRVVTDNDKQRFEWDVAADRIRARQGHSVAGRPRPRRPPRRPPSSSTAPRGALIRSSPPVSTGASATTSTSPPTATRPPSSAPARGEHVVLVVDAARMHADGRAFWVTGNGVWLTDSVPASYLDVVL